MTVLEHHETNSAFYVVSEKLTGPTLLKAIAQCPHFSEQTAAQYIQSAFLAVSCLHEHGLIYKDLNPANLIVTAPGEVKLVSYGVSSSTEHPQRHSQFSFAAPEVFTGKASEKSDSWSIGAILYFLLSGKHAFTGNNWAELKKSVCTGKVVFAGDVWEKVSSECKDFITGLLKKGPSQRSSCEKALKHPWLKIAGDCALISSSSLLKYHASSQIEEAFHQYLAQEVATSCEKRTLLVLFKDSCFLSASEIRDSIESSGIEPAVDLDRIMGLCDIEGTGNISVQELVSTLFVWKELFQREKLKKTLNNSAEFDNREVSLVTLKDSFSESEFSSLVPVFQELDPNAHLAVTTTELRLFLLSKLKT